MTAAADTTINPPRDGGRFGAVRSWFHSLPPFLRVVLSVGAVVLTANVLFQFLGAIDERRGLKNAPRAFDRTDDDGYAAFVKLVEQSGHPVEIRRDGFGPDDLRTDGTVVMLAPERMTDRERSELVRMLDGGGRLVFGGDLGAFRPIADIDEASPLEPLDLRRTGGGGAFGYQGQPVVPLPETAGVTTVEFGRGQTWENTGPLLPLLVTDDGDIPILAGRYPSDADDFIGDGDGYVVAIANGSFLDNEHLAVADNAAFSLSLLGAPDRPVIFVDTKNELGGQGLAALPTSWTWTLVLTALAGLLLVWSRAVRFGPPDRPRRELAPARVEYVDHLARTLASKDDMAATIQPLQERALGRLAVGKGRTDSMDAETHERLRRSGLSTEQVALLRRGPRTSADALEIGRITADLEQRRGSRGSPT